MNSLERLTNKAIEVLQKSYKQDNLTAKNLISYIVQVQGLGKYLIDLIPPKFVKKTEKINIEEILKGAYYQAAKLEHTYVGTEHLYLALISIFSSKELEKARISLTALNVFPHSLQNAAYSQKKTPLIDSFATDLNEKAIKNFHRKIVYRDEYEKLVSALLLRDKGNVLLVGDTGVGKKTLVEMLAYNINSLEVPPFLAEAKIINLNILNFMSSMANKGGIELGITSLVEELRNYGIPILVLENFQEIFLSTPSGITAPLFYTILKEVLYNEGITIITYLHPSFYEKIISENDQLVDDFTVVEVDEPGEETTREIIRINAKYYEDFHNIKVSDQNLDYIYNISQKSKRSIKFPQKALDLLDYTCSYVNFKKSKIPQKFKELVDSGFDLEKELDENLAQGKFNAALKNKEEINKLETLISKKEKLIFNGKKPLEIEKTDIDHAANLLEYDSPAGNNAKVINKFGKLTEAIKKELIGQDSAVDIVTKALVRAKLGLRSTKRPLGNFLFLGPTGVGKTEFAKILAKYAFATEDWTGLIRLDMSDFSEKHNVARLVGAPPGYVGYGEGGELTTKIDAHPQSVVLFDEIEKAHPDVLNILLQIMEEGELTDAKGVTFDFSESVIILTSNLGTEILHNQGIGFDEKDIPDKNLEKRLKENLKRILKPELINRFDEVVVFNRLNKRDLTKIVNILIKEVKTILLNQQIELKMGKGVKPFLLDKGYSKEYGARALRRTIEKELLDKIAQILLNNHERPLFITSELKKDNIKVETSIIK